MQLISRVKPVFFPDPDQVTVLRLGLQALELKSWMPSDEDLPSFHQHKLQSKKQFGDKVYQAKPESIAAQLELRELLMQHLLTDQKRLYMVANNKLQYLPTSIKWSLEDTSLWQSSLWVQDDICIMELIDDNYCLTAASVCCPSNWKLEQKIGGSLDSIHDPVPGYDQVLASRVKRLFDNIKPSKPLLRFNWSIQNNNELLWRDDLTAQADLTDDKYWRVERQTLRRLPATGAIIFTIRIYLHSFEVMKTYAGFSNNVATLVANLPEPQKRYKGLKNQA